jgi:anti-sigma B factor antagonist
MSADDGRILEIRHRLHGDTAVVVLVGEIDVSNAAEVRTYLQELLDLGHDRMVVDCSGLDFVDSVALGVLVGIHHRLAQFDGALHIAAPSVQVRRILTVTQLVKVLPVHESVDEALSRVGETPTIAGG